MENTLTAGQLARRLNVSKPTVGRLARGGKLPAPANRPGTQVWREADIANWERAGFPLERGKFAGIGPLADAVRELHGVIARLKAREADSSLDLTCRGYCNLLRQLLEVPSLPLGKRLFLARLDVDFQPGPIEDDTRLRLSAMMRDWVTLYFQVTGHGPTPMESGQ